jgi:rRNA-processing protein FCF1
VGTGVESADDWITRRAAELSEPYVLVTSDRELRERAGGNAERIVGGGAFARELSGLG